LIISKKNDVYVKVDTEPNIARELVDFFTFEVPGARFMPTYKSRVWDGKIRLYNQMSGEIYFGLVPYVEEFAKRNDISIEYGEGVKDEGEHRDAVLGGFVRRVSPKSKGKSLQIRDYQMAAFVHAVRNNRSLSLSPTASGKSLIIYLLSRWYESNRVLILVPTTSLVEQMYSDFLDYGYVESKMQKIYQGHSREITKEVTISTWQSLYKMPRKYFEQFGCIIGDEVHLFKAKSLTNIMNKMHQTQYRHGFTGTLDGMQTHQLVLEGLFGSVNRVTSTKELMDKNTLAKLNIKCIVLQYPDADKKFMKDQNYQDEVDLLVRDERRNKFIVNLTTHLKGNTLVLFQFVEKHGAVLYDMMKDLDRKVFYVWGGTDTQTRENIREITEKEKNAIIVASYGTFSTGINIRNLHNVVFSSPSKSRIRVLQSIGRGLRQGTDKSTATLYDIADDLTWKTKQNFTLRHFMERINIYNEEEFDYEIKNLPIES
jgi:superfamily II DNA or RNA helicase|tara:strand:+ start:568 stop:2019 length:1452 start_codon:yes stop_codon:yes gene_type:complete